jgi:hypothetical protein
MYLAIAKLVIPLNCDSEEECQKELINLLRNKGLFEHLSQMEFEEC